MGTPLTLQDPKGALVLFSGGQDSATVLAWSLDRYERVETVGYRYGQKHVIELECREYLRRTIRRISPVWHKRLGPDHIIEVDLVGQISGKKIAQPSNNRPTRSEYEAGSAYIPGRNLILLSMSASVAFRRNIATLVCGASETEYSGYPDCRQTSIGAIETAISACSGSTFRIECPLMQLDKAGVWRMAFSLGGEPLVEAIRVQSHTCYSGERDVLHEWGYGCGECAACKLRQSGWTRFRSTS